VTEPGRPAAPPPSGERRSEAGEFADFFRTDELPDRPGRPRSHRATAAPVVQRLLPSATAVGVVVVVILLLVWINGKPAGKGPGAGVITGPPPKAVVPTPAGTAQASPSPSSATAPSPTASASGALLVPTHRHPSLASARAPVAVLNNSRITGLAAQAAEQLRAKQWNVIAIGNLQQLTPETTVYFPPGRKLAAEHLAHDFGQIRRVLPNSAGGFHARHLTLVVTRDWS
jgi:hypothetical protein